MTSARSGASWLLVVVSVACDAPSQPHDAGTDAGTSSVAIMEPARPVLTPCPAGWAEVTVGGIVVCDPTPGGAIDCEDGEVRFPGSAACEPVGRACPAGEFAADLPSSGVLYVRPGGSGDGSLVAPFGTIAAALAAASPGDTVALAKGVYDEPIVMRTGVTVRGACAAETVLQRSAARDGGSIRALDGVSGALVADVGVRRSDNIGVEVRGELRLEGVTIEEAQLFGTIVLGGRLSAEGLLVRATRTGDGAEGGGVAIVDGGVVALRRAVLAENHQYGIGVGLGCRAELTDVASRSQRLGAGATRAPAILAEGGTVIGERVELSDARGAAAFATEGGVIELTDAVVATCRADGMEHGFGLRAFGGVIRARRVWIRDAQGAAASLSGGELTIGDAVISGTVAPPLSPGWAVGVTVAGRGAGVLERVLVEGGMAGGVLAVGLEAAPPSETTLSATDLAVRDIVADGASGLGVGVFAAHAELTRIAIERATHAALIATDGAHLSVRHARVTETRADPIDGRWGRGLEVVRSDAEIEHARFEGQREVALMFSGGRSVLSAIEVVDTRERGCADTTCADAPGGIGIGVYADARVSVADFTIDGAPLCGVQIALGGQLDLSEGVITGTSIGACVQVDGYDVARLARGVAYRETDTTIQTTTHWVPETHDPLP